MSSLGIDISVSQSIDYSHKVSIQINEKKQVSLPHLSRWGGGTTYYIYNHQH